MKNTNAFTKYYKTVHYLESLNNLPLKQDYLTSREHPEEFLKRMRYFLTLLGNPDKDLKFIHITGTAGKGTVTNMLHEVLHAAGKKVGSFTSPFVTTSIEKIKVNDLYISPKAFTEIVESIKPAIDKAHKESPYGMPSYFDIFVAVALLYFKEQKCEWVILEVGLGGRYDSTNVIKNPVITAITNIDYDHTEILGNTLEKIAYDKAGIIKAGSEFFTGEQRKHIVKLFQEICKQKKVTLHQVAKQQNYKEYNTRLVRAIAEKLNIQEAAILAGIKKAKLQARFEVLQTKPVVIIDGAHNRAKMHSTAENIKKLKYKKLHVVIGISQNKLLDPVLKEIIPYADTVYFTRYQSKDRKSAHPKELFTISKSKRYFKKHAETDIFLDPVQALDLAMKNAGKEDVVLITGSFFLAGELRKYWISEEYILKSRKGF